MRQNVHEPMLFSLNSSFVQMQWQYIFSCIILGNEPGLYEIVIHVYLNLTLQSKCHKNNEY